MSENLGLETPSGPALLGSRQGPVIGEPYSGGEGWSTTAKKPSRVAWLQASNGWSKDEFEFFDEEEEFGEKIEYRICHDVDFITKLESPCACKGTIKILHLLGKLFEGLTVPGIRRELHSAEFASEEVERLLEAEFDECNNETHENENGATTWRKAILIFLTILLLKHVKCFTDLPHESDKSSSSFYETGGLARAEISIVINSGGNTRNIHQLDIASTSQVMPQRF
ncbi:hypothetical protein CRYUN_Cryun22dG0027500 [Craigia yunnanensis]